MGGYVWHMRSTVISAIPATDTQPVAPPISGTAEQVTFYIAYDSPGVLLPETDTLPLPSDHQQRALELLRALIARYAGKSSSHALAQGSDIREVYLVDPGMAVIDCNTNFANGHRSGILVEELTLTSMVQTLAANIPGITRVKFLVEGKERETLAGHADLMNVYVVADIAQMASALQASQ